MAFRPFIPWRIWTNLSLALIEAWITIDVFAKDLPAPHFITSVKWVALGGLELGLFLTWSGEAHNVFAATLALLPPVLLVSCCAFMVISEKVVPVIIIVGCAGGEADGFLKVHCCLLLVIGSQFLHLIKALLAGLNVVEAIKFLSSITG